MTSKYKVKVTKMLEMLWKIKDDIYTSLKNVPETEQHQKLIAKSHKGLLKAGYKISSDGKIVPICNKEK